MRQPPPADLSPPLSRTTELNKLLRQLAPRLGKIAGGRLDVAVISSPGPAYVTGDDVTLAQLVITAVSRAREHALPGAWIVAAVTPEVMLGDGVARLGPRAGESVMLSLCGSGIDPVAWDEWSETANRCGSVEVDIVPGLGSAAHVYFPVESRGQSLMARGGGGASSRRTVLAWLADAGSGGLTRDLLDATGFHVRSVTTAAEVLYQLSARSSDADILLADVALDPSLVAPVTDALSRLHPGMPIVRVRADQSAEGHVVRLDPEPDPTAMAAAGPASSARALVSVLRHELAGRGRSARASAWS